MVEAWHFSACSYHTHDSLIVHRPYALEKKRGVGDKSFRRPLAKTQSPCKHYLGALFQAIYPIILRSYAVML